MLQSLWSYMLALYQLSKKNKVQFGGKGIINVGKLAAVECFYKFLKKDIKITYLFWLSICKFILRSHYIASTTYASFMCVCFFHIEG